MGVEVRRVVAVLTSAVGSLGLMGCGGDEFVPYSPSAELVPLLEEDTVVFRGGFLGIDASVGDCGVREMVNRRESGPNASEWRTLKQSLDDPERERGVSFATQRFETRQALEDHIARVAESLNDPCAGQGGVEPASLDGLPDGALTAHWSGEDEGDGWTTVIADHDRQLMMTVRWVDRPDPVPTDSFVDVVNTAWADFVIENSR